MAKKTVKKTAKKTPARKPKSQRKGNEEKAQSHSNRLKNLGPNQLKPDDPERIAHGHALLDEVQEMDIIEFATKVLGVSFDKRPAQELALRCMYGLPIPEGTCEVYVEEPSDDGSLILQPTQMTWMELYTLLTGNEEEFEPGVEKSEAVFCIGRRGGKSFNTSIIIDFESTRQKWRQYLNKDEVAWALITATRQEQAENILLDTCYNLINNAKLRFNYLIDDKVRSVMTLRNGYKVAAYPCSSSAGLGLAAYIHAFDELAYYGVTGPKSDKKVVAALTPAQLQFSAGTPKTAMISTPAGKQGYFYELVEQGSQVPGRLTIRAPSWVFNPPSAYDDPKYKRLKRKHREDPDAFDIWYRANFAEMMDAFIQPEDVDAVAVHSDSPIPYEPRHYYLWGADQSGLTGNDRFSFAVGHKDASTGKTIVDAVYSWQTKDGDEIIANIRGLAQRYNLTMGMIDRYASGWVASALEKVPLVVKLRPSKPDIYNNMKTLILAEKVELPQRKPLLTAIKRAQAFYGNRSNTLSIVHERSSTGHGDESDAVATLIYALGEAGWTTGSGSRFHRATASRNRQAEEDYDPLTYGRV